MTAIISHLNKPIGWRIECCEFRVSRSPTMVGTDYSTFGYSKDGLFRWIFLGDEEEVARAGGGEVYLFKDENYAKTTLNRLLILFLMRSEERPVPGYYTTSEIKMIRNEDREKVLLEHEKFSEQSRIESRFFLMQYILRPVIDK